LDELQTQKARLRKKGDSQAVFPTIVPPTTTTFHVPATSLVPSSPSPPSSGGGRETIDGDRGLYSSTTTLSPSLTLLNATTISDSSQHGGFID
jgi:hypothetical protein